MNATLDKPPQTVTQRLERPLPAASVTLEAALIGIESARLALKCSEDQLMAWILAGNLEWAFDLRGKKNSRAYVRILTQSVVKLQQPLTPLNLRRRDWAAWVSAAPSFETIFDSVFRHHRPWIRSSELVQVWNCCSGHIRNLIDLKFLEVAPRPYLSNEARLISRQSVRLLCRNGEFIDALSSLNKIEETVFNTFEINNERKNNMNKNRIKLAQSLVRTREDMESLVAEITNLKNDQRLLPAQMDSQIQKIRERYEAQLAACTQTLEEKLELARAWGEANPDQFGTARSIEMVHGVVGWRRGQPSLKTVAGWTWDRVKDTLKAIGAAAYIRTKEDVNKQNLLADRDAIGAEKLRQIGLRVAQEESFFVDPKLTDVECELRI